MCDRTRIERHDQLVKYGHDLFSKKSIVNQDYGFSEFPVFYKLDVKALFGMLRRITGRVVWANYSSLGCSNATAERARLDAFANSVAYGAVLAAYVVCTKKAPPSNFPTNHEERVVSSLAATFPTHMFPLFMAELINSIGPCQVKAWPAQRTHIPLLDAGDIIRIRPHNADVTSAQIFNEKIVRTRIDLVNIDLSGSAPSSPWWMLQPHDLSIALSPTFELGSGEDTYLPVRRVLAPFRPDECEHFLKIAGCLMPNALTTSGPGPCSASPWYSHSELRFTGSSTPKPCNFPQEARTHPYFWDKSPARAVTVESKARAPRAMQDTNAHVPLGDPVSLASITSVGDPSEAHAEPSLKRRRQISPEHGVDINSCYDSVSPEPVDRQQGFQDKSDNMYRLVYHYCDHIALDHAHPAYYLRWAYEMCQSR